jgi:hypothetical protein
MATYIRGKHLSRRTLLRGAGAAVALPLLDAMVPAGVARAQTAAVPKPRLAALYMPHGAVMAHWTPVAEGAGFAFTETLKPLEPFRDRINVISDLALPLAYGTDGAGGEHARSSAVYLSGAAVTMDGAPKLGVTMDQVAARHIGQDTPLPSLELCIEDGGLSCGAGGACAFSNTISWQSDVAPLPMQNNPQVVFERLFGDGATDEERSARRRESLSLLDSVLDDVAALDREISAPDRALVERYLEDVREVERRIALAAGQIPEYVAIPEKPQGIPDDFDAHAKLLFDLQTLAWQADLTRVTTMMLAREASNITFPSSGVADPFHPLSHHSNIEAQKEKLARLNRYHVGVFAYLVEKLANTPDGEGTLLDHALVLYGSGMSNSNEHDHDPLPIVLAGGAAGRLEGGRHIRAGAQQAPLSNLLLALLDKLGAPAESFGDSTGMMAI